jgi:hypothetical protein
VVLRLPHPEFAAMIEAVKGDVVRHETIVLVGLPIAYAVFRSDAATPDLAFYDEHGTIYLPESLLQFNASYAHLIALHEHIEIQHKRAGRPHAYAHRRAVLAMLLVAREIFGASQQLAAYLAWHIGLYPTWKNLDQQAVVEQLMGQLAADKPRRGALLGLITDHAL